MIVFERNVEKLDKTRLRAMVRKLMAYADAFAANKRKYYLLLWRDRARMKTICYRFFVSLNKTNYG